jgi:hypothetical protein
MTKRMRARAPVEQIEDDPETERREFASVVDVNGIDVTVSARAFTDEFVRLSISEPIAVPLNPRQARAIRDAIDAALRFLTPDGAQAIRVDCPHSNLDPDDP